MTFSDESVGRPKTVLYTDAKNYADLSYVVSIFPNQEGDHEGMKFISSLNVSPRDSVQ